MLQDRIAALPWGPLALEREGRALRAVGHSAFVRAYGEVGLYEGLPALLLELIEGTNLVSLMQGCRQRGVRPGPDAVAAIGAQIADALSALHAAGYYRCDLTPSNVLVESSARVRLVDLGIVLGASKEELPDAIVHAGTRDYVAPEQLRGEPVGPASDVYALGQVLRYLAGSPAPPPLDRIIRVCTADEPRLRPSADEVAERLSGPAGDALERLLLRLEGYGLDDVYEADVSTQRGPDELISGPVMPEPAAADLMSQVEAPPAPMQMGPPPALRLRPPVPAPRRRAPGRPAPRPPTPAPSPRAAPTGPSPAVTSPGSRPPSFPVQEPPSAWIRGSELGRGGMGVVYRARRGSQEAALKVPNAVGAEGVAFEGRLASKLTPHPNVRGGVDGSADGVLLELVFGDALSSVLWHGPLSAEDAAAVARGVAAGLAFLHRFEVDGRPLQIVHGQVHPANILLSEDGRPVLIDLSAARTVDNPPDAGIVMGVMSYLAPEQLVGERADAKIDVYGLGLCLFHMLTGRNRHEGSRPGEPRPSFEPSELPAVPAGLAVLVGRMLALDPDARPTADQVVASLDVYLDASAAELAERVASLAMSVKPTGFASPSSPRPSFEAMYDSPPGQAEPLAFAAPGAQLAHPPPPSPLDDLRPQPAGASVDEDWHWDEAPEHRTVIPDLPTPPGVESTPRAVPDVPLPSLLLRLVPEVGRPLELRGESASIGRGPRNDHVIRSAALSRNHALVERGPEGPRIIDLNSANGTYLNAARVVEATLSDGDRLRLGSHTFVVSLPA